MALGPAGVDVSAEDHRHAGAARFTMLRAGRVQRAARRRPVHGKGCICAAELQAGPELRKGVGQGAAIFDLGVRGLTAAVNAGRCENRIATWLLVKSDLEWPLPEVPPNSSTFPDATKAARLKGTIAESGVKYAEKGQSGTFRLISASQIVTSRCRRRKRTSSARAM